MGKIRQIEKNLSLKKSIVCYIGMFAALAIAFSVSTAAICNYAAGEINKNYPPTGEKYYLTNQKGERLGEGTYIYQNMAPLSERDERLLDVLDILPVVATPLYSFGGILAAAFFFYRNKLKEPLARLQEASEKISRNELDFQLDYHSRDEMGQLCASFEFMRKTLASNFSEIWRQMEERKQLNAAFAHDLRTPLTVLKGYNELLQTSGDSKTRNTAVTMGRHIQRLERYVDSMSHLRRLEDASPQYAETDMGKLLDTFRESTGILCEQKKAALKWEKHLTSSRACLDEAFLSQVYQNLISNALRYAKKEVCVVFSQTEKGIILTVSDDGPGFSQEVLKKAANPYFTEEENRTEHFGLGLYICKLLCEHHGGWLRIENGAQGAKLTACFSIQIVDKK